MKSTHTKHVGRWQMLLHTLALAGVSLTALIFLTASAIAANYGGGGDGGSSAGGGTDARLSAENWYSQPDLILVMGEGGERSGTADTQCFNGKVYDKKKKMCVRPQPQPDNG